MGVPAVGECARVSKGARLHGRSSSMQIERDREEPKRSQQPAFPMEHTTTTREGRQRCARALAASAGSIAHGLVPWLVIARLAASLSALPQARYALGPLCFLGGGGTNGIVLAASLAAIRSQSRSVLFLSVFFFFLFVHLFTGCFLLEPNAQSWSCAVCVREASCSRLLVPSVYTKARPLPGCDPPAGEAALSLE